MFSPYKGVEINDGERHLFKLFIKSLLIRVEYKNIHILFDMWYFN